MGLDKTKKVKYMMYIHVSYILKYNILFQIYVSLWKYTAAPAAQAPLSVQNLYLGICKYSPARFLSKL